MIVQGIIAILFLILGIVFASGKGTSLIAGYNTLSEDEKAKYDEKRLTKNMSAMMFSFAACMAVGFIGSLIGIKWMIIVSFCLMIPFMVFFVIRMNVKSKK